MNQTVTLLLLFAGDGKLTSTERHALSTFQAREKVALAAPAPSPSFRSGGGRLYSDVVANRIEAALDEAQTLAASLDEERALVLLADVERELLAHPELPQAAWLMAERYQLAAAIRRRQPGGGEDADRFVASAEALEGPRAVPFGEGDGSAAPEATVSRPRTAVLFAVRDLDRSDRLLLDGNEARKPLYVLPGRHHAQVRRDSRIAWAGWFDVPAAVRVDKLLGVPQRIACSHDDLLEVTPGRRAPSVPAGVHCPRWIAVRRGASGLEVAWCEGGRCTAYGPLLREQLEPEERATIPPWLAATLVGAATVGAGALLIATGTFERDRPAPVVEFVYRGPE